MFNPSTVKLGKLPARNDVRTLKMSKYLAEALPSPPEQVDITAKITDLGMMLNNKIGDCVIASGGHTIQAWTAEAGNQVIIPDSVIESVYSAITGYKKGDPSTDNGTVIIDFLNYWRKIGIDGHKIGAYVRFDPTNQIEFKQAIYYFGAAVIGVLLPISFQGQQSWTGVPTNDPDTVPGTWGGHGITAVRYNPEKTSVISWGAYVDFEWNSVAAYCDEAYALISPDQLDGNGLTPQGFNMEQLQEDLARVTA